MVQVEKAGGKTSDGVSGGSILDIEIKGIDQVRSDQIRSDQIRWTLQATGPRTLPAAAMPPLRGGHFDLI